MNQKNQNQFGSDDNQDKSLSNSQQSQNNTSKISPELQKKNLDEKNKASQFSDEQHQDQQKQSGHQNLGQQGARQSDMGGNRSKSQQS